jgi:hypothetical protein
VDINRRFFKDDEIIYVKIPIQNPKKSTFGILRIDIDAVCLGSERFSLRGTTKLNAIFIKSDNSCVCERELMVLASAVKLEVSSKSGKDDYPFHCLQVHTRMYAVLHERPKLRLLAYLLTILGIKVSFFLFIFRLPSLVSFLTGGNWTCIQTYLVSLFPYSQLPLSHTKPVVPTLG